MTLSLLFAVCRQFKAARERFYRITAGGGLQQTPCNVMKFMGTYMHIFPINL